MSPTAKKSMSKEEVPASTSATNEPRRGRLSNMFSIGKASKQKKKTTRQEEDAASRSSCPSESIICPITLSLPFDPVTAMDGRIYERTAIKTYFKGKEKDIIKSPYTNEPMSTKILAAPHIKNLIESLVESGAIQGELATEWKEKLSEKKSMEELLKKANNGDSWAMGRVGDNYRWGDEGFEMDKKKACAWYKKQHEAGSALGTAKLGVMMATGADGSPPDTATGVLYLGMACGQGSDWACFKLGAAMAMGKYGLPVDTTRAIYWLKKSLSGECPHRHMTKLGTERAQKKLSEVMASED